MQFTHPKSKNHMAHKSKDQQKHHPSHSFASKLSLHVSWIDIDGTNECGAAYGFEYVPGETTTKGQAIEIPDSRVWFVMPLSDFTREMWSELILEIKKKEIPGLSDRGFMTDDVLKQIGQLEHLEFLDLLRCVEITNNGLKYLYHLKNLRRLYLSRCHGITDDGLGVLEELPYLNVLRIERNKAITDTGVASLKDHQHLQMVTIQGTKTGDQSIATLKGKPTLTHISLGDNTTDAGLALLREFSGLKVLNEDRNRMWKSIIEFRHRKKVK